MKKRSLPVLALLLSGLVPAAASAATFNVNSLSDTTDANPGNGVCATAASVCSLRAAVVESNALAGADVINVPANTYNVATTLPITSVMTVRGKSADSTVIKGNGSQTVLDISNAGAVEFSDLAVTGGNLGVVVAGTEATFRRVAIRDNVGSSSASVRGAGIFIFGAGGKVFLRQSSVTNNKATSTANDASGAGVFMNTPGTLDAEETTFAGNQANATSSGLAVDAWGGGIYATSGKVSLRHVTLIGNTATAGTGYSYGGNLYANGAAVTVTDSIIANGVAGPSYENCGGVKPTAAGRNIDSGTTCGFGAGHLSSTNPLLETLGDFGGGTSSAPPKLGSPALGQASACPTSGFDQRGVAAPAGTGCDIGAAELGADLVTTLQASRSSVPKDGDLTYVVRVANDGPDPAGSVVLDLNLAGAARITSTTSTTGSCSTATRCEIGQLAKGASATVSMTVQAGSSGSVNATATASMATPETAAANNTVSLAVPIAGVSVAPSNTTPPTVAGQPMAGKTLSANDGAWAGSPAPTLTRSWQRCNATGSGCTTIAGETGSSYTVTAADINATIRVLVTATNAAGTVSTPSAVTGLVSEEGAPVLSRRPTVSVAVRSTPGKWNPASTAVTIRWQRCTKVVDTSCKNIPGATAERYRPTNADAGMRLRSIAAAKGTSTEKMSAISDTVQQHLVAPRIITRKPRVGSVLRMTPGRWAKGTTTHAYQWKRCATKGTRCVTIRGARKVTYRVARADRGSRLQVVITTRNVAKRKTLLTVSTKVPVAR